MTEHDNDEQAPKPVFGQWLMTQKDRTDLVGQLAVGAVADATMPPRGAASRS